MKLFFPYLLISSGMRYSPRRLAQGLRVRIRLKPEFKFKSLFTYLKRWQTVNGIAVLHPNAFLLAHRFKLHSSGSGSGGRASGFRWAGRLRQQLRKTWTMNMQHLKKWTSEMARERCLNGKRYLIPPNRCNVQVDLFWMTFCCPAPCENQWNNETVLHANDFGQHLN